MYRKPKRSKFHLRDHIFFVFALLFLCASLLRTTPAISKLQQTVQTFLSGKLSFEETVQAVGSFPSTESQACFEAPQIESSLPPETLAATAAGVFPSDIDPFIPSSHAFYPSPLADSVCVSPFGLRKHPISGKQKLHKGIDFAAPEGEPIYALSDGIIRTAAESSGYGNYIILEHADGLCSLYAHCKKLLVRTGSPVKAGQTIAQVGETGAATGAHLHLELWRAGKLLNPEDYIAL